MEQKLLTIAIPCFNSQDYVEAAIQSAISGGRQVEVLVVDDGSTDSTADIAKRYEKEHPEIVRYLYKENGGHGDAVMCGLANANGMYYKVLDSDDRLDESALQKVLSVLAQYSDEKTYLDMFVANYEYDKAGASHKVEIDYTGALPVNRVFTWDEVGHFKLGHNLLMHAVIYRTEFLKSCGLTLPKHTFYVDNIFVYYPLPFVEKMYYIDENLYIYKIGRQDQSVNESVMIKRIDQQLYVNKLMIDMHDLSKIKNEKLRDYMAQYLAMILSVSSALLVHEGSKESLLKKDDLWKHMHKTSEEMYAIVHKKLLSKIVEKDGKTMNKIIDMGYGIAQKIYHFN